MKYELQTTEWGRLYVVENTRAKRIVVRSCAEGLKVTVPCGIQQKELLQTLQKMEAQLTKLRDRSPILHIDLSYQIQAPFFQLTVKEGVGSSFFLQQDGAKHLLVCPAQVDFSAATVQERLKRAVVEAMRVQAKLVLPTRLYQLAEKNGFTYQAVSINSSRGRWGSCTAAKKINLSLSLLLLPTHLIDYVLLHELVHLKEMNHGTRFWALLDQLTDGQSHRLRTELKQYHPL
ncbi:MAG: YgjP-like metallopeptidase domain-containing protein [Bacteroidaceae bacterium]